MLALRLATFQREVQDLRAHYGCQHKNLVTIQGEQSKWQVWNLAVEAVRESIARLQTYLHNIGQGVYYYSLATNQCEQVDGGRFLSYTLKPYIKTSIALSKKVSYIEGLYIEKRDIYPTYQSVYSGICNTSVIESGPLYHSNLRGFESLGVYCSIDIVYVR